MSGQMIICPPMPVCRPQPAPWSYTPSWKWNPPYPNQCGCGCGTPCTCQPPPLFGPIVGVIDGSDAAPGMVGEFVIGIVSVPYAGSPTVTDTIVSVLVVQPGDWDLWASAATNTATGGVSLGLSPVPAGMSSTMTGSLFVGGANNFEEMTVICQPARGSFSVPTLLAFECTIFQNTTTLPAGTLTVQVAGRRRR